MFNVIEACEHHLYELPIKRLVKELQIAVNFQPTQDLTDAIYMLVGEEIKEFQGGIVLLKQPLETVPLEIGSYLRDLCPQYQSCSKIWTGRIAFQVSQDLSGVDYERLSKLFYRILYEDLVAFSVKENTPFLCLTLPLVEHLSIDMLGLWPYLLKVSPNASSDGLFHGLLSLTKEEQDRASILNFEKVEEGIGHFSPQNCDNIITS